MVLSLNKSIHVPFDNDNFDSFRQLFKNMHIKYHDNAKIIIICKHLYTKGLRLSRVYAVIAVDLQL